MLWMRRGICVWEASVADGLVLKSAENQRELGGELYPWQSSLLIISSHAEHGWQDPIAS
jgi:hypothetical protein